MKDYNIYLPFYFGNGKFSVLGAKNQNGYLDIIVLGHSWLGHLHPSSMEKAKNGLKKANDEWKKKIKNDP